MDDSSKCPPYKRTRQKNYVKWKKRAASTSLQTALWCVLFGLIVFRVWDLNAETSTLQICLFKLFYLSLMRWIQSWFCLELWFGMLYGRLGIKLNLKLCLLMLITSSKKFQLYLRAQENQGHTSLRTNIMFSIFSF